MPSLVRSMSTLLADAQEVEHHVDPEDMPFLHHGDRPRFWKHKKFKSPRKRASSLLHDLEQEQMDKIKKANPQVWNTQFRVGDAIEVKLVGQGGVNSEKYERIRGVVLGRVNRGLSTTVLLRDLLLGMPIERSVALFSPLVKTVTLLERNFAFRGNKRVKKAKLYHLRGKSLGSKLTNIYILLLRCRNLRSMPFFSHPHTYIIHSLPSLKSFFAISSLVCNVSKHFR